MKYIFKIPWWIVNFGFLWPLFWPARWAKRMYDVTYDDAGIMEGGFILQVMWFGILFMLYYSLR